MVETIDLFVYNGEPIVELRLEYLYPLVDHIVIVEKQRDDGSFYHELHDDVFRPYEQKIKFLKVCDDNVHPFDVAQGYLMQTFHNCIVMACDIGSIPCAQSVVSLPTRYFSLQNPTWMQMSTYVGSYEHVSDTYSLEAFCVNDMGMQDHKLSEMMCSNKALYIPMCGWHASCFDNDSHMDHTKVSNNFLPDCFNIFNAKLMFLKRYAPWKK